MGSDAPTFTLLDSAPGTSTMLILIAILTAILVEAKPATSVHVAIHTSVITNATL